MKPLASRILAVCLITASSTFGLAASPGEDANPQSVSGKWSGSFEINQPDGSVKKDTAWLNIHQDGGAITGTAGPNEGQQWEIKEGRVNGAQVQFTVEKEGGMHLVFDLHLEGSHLKGEAAGTMPEGKVKVAVDTTRLDVQAKP